MYLFPCSLGLWYPVNHCHQSDVTSGHSNHSSDGSFDIQEDHVISGGVSCGHLGRRCPASSYSSCECRSSWHYPKQMKEKGKGRPIDRQTDRQTNGRIDGQTDDRQNIGSLTDRERDRQTNFSNYIV